uniref:PS II complex 12 kDa extrinsic protein n=1 Tax=Proboscia inermis TaxID=420281 RepID=A0A7S0GMM2_9STRA|mmetsp:Transcript_27022/g.33161  ORF Transcript_27022/g.33161 Transcript_27022/m.33161 type:complete len:230 (+) Transcript_27022:48-737(+)|eukprot:CAMPEP_0171323840 /NCGR_PEP_ID=MMETSP0816-20121228/115822_1 /TAXON_ID=420281 /ORGANISM="Proboscia inermis, Strain CCAP1064/1" /LENGTH=229 /DNA_ID=CAMNT_0011822651 /DNA_START=568 /DNA_END=1257 /DNA_ORIENTATION=+
MMHPSLLSILVVAIVRSSSGFTQGSVSLVGHNLSKKSSFTYLESTPDTQAENGAPSIGIDSSIYERIGFAEDEVALGIEPKDVLQWLGTREDMTAKVLKDNRSFDEDRAADEVTKLMMDAEMVNSFIAYEKKKADPNFIKEIRDETLSDPRVIAQYIAWIGGGVGFAYFRNKVIEPKFASGEWQPIKIKLPFQDMPGDAVDMSDAAVSVSQVIHSVSDSIPTDITDFTC